MHKSLLPLAIALCSLASGATRPLVFPKPQEMEVLANRFTLDGRVVLLLPTTPSKVDLDLSRLLLDELSDHYDLHLKTRRGGSLPPGQRAILMGSFANPLVKAHCVQRHLDLTAHLGPEGYLLLVDEQLILIAGADDAGAFYGLQSLRQLIQNHSEGLQLQAVRIRDWPNKPFRGFKLYLPGRANIPFFKRFVRDFLALYKYNKLIIEMNACMRFDRHPELNAGWVEFARDTNYSRRNYPPGPPHQLEQNSSHQDTADGGFLEKEEVADLLRWAQRHYLEVIPEIPSLTHSYYLLSRHRDLAEVPDEKWPDTYCPLNPKSYDLLFDVLDEYIQVMKPRMIHIGHDEFFTPIDQCPRCRGKDYGVLFAGDVSKVHNYLARRGISTAMWGDMLLQAVRGSSPRRHVTRAGWAFKAPAALNPAQVKDLFPKDILLFNWFWSGKNAESREQQLDELGFRQIYGNFGPRVRNYAQRSKRATLIGGAPSSWAATTEFNIGKDQLLDLLGCEGLLWSSQDLPPAGLMAAVQAMVPQIRESLSGEVPPSQTGDAVAPIDISASFNSAASESALALDLAAMRAGKVHLGSKVLDLASDAGGGKVAVVVGTEGKESNPLPRSVEGIRIGQDATSLIFLHACARPATNKEAFRLLWDFDDTADLLGWYEVVFEDGLVQTIPIRYGVNILEWSWGQRESGRVYCYGADVVECSSRPDTPITFFALEWKNPRFGKVIREVHLKGTTGFRGGVEGFEDTFGPVIPANAVVLKAISYVKRRD